LIILYSLGLDTTDGITDKLVRVTLSQLPYFLPDEIMVKQLLEGLRRYGKVCQIKKITNRGYFEGDAVVLMDIKKVDGITWQPLARKLYLDPWDMEVTASFRGAPPICYGCRESGHIREHCPKMENVKCYNCYGKGHFARQCKNPTRTEKEALDEYVRLAALRDSELRQAETTDIVAPRNKKILGSKKLLGSKRLLRNKKIPRRHQPTRNREPNDRAPEFRRQW
jgi:hypothetical protein